MWCFVVLFTFLRTLSAPKLCVQHHCPVHIPFPSTPSRQRNSLQLWGSSANFLIHFIDSAALRDAHCEFLYKPQGASRHCFGWDTTGSDWSLLMSRQWQGWEQRARIPILGLQHQPLDAFPGSSSVSGERSPPAPPGLLCRSSWAVRDYPFPPWGDLWRTGAGFSWSSNTEGHQESFWLKTSWKA